jgi:hypothetical protein
LNKACRINIEAIKAMRSGAINHTCAGCHIALLGQYDNRTAQKLATDKESGNDW